MSSAATDVLTGDVLLDVGLPGSLLVRQSEMDRLVLGVVGGGQVDRGEDVKRDLAVRGRVLDRLVLAEKVASESQRRISSPVDRAPSKRERLRAYLAFLVASKSSTLFLNVQGTRPLRNRLSTPE